MSMTWGQLSGLLAKNSLEKRIPLIGEFELTSRCNLSCKMCYVCRRANDKNAIRKERSAKEWIKLAYEARDAGMLFLLLTGGEVFLRKDFKIIYDEMSMMGFNLSMYTNGTLITPQVASWLGRIAPSQIEVTLYGASPETYNRLCGDATGFERAVRGIQLLKDQGINVQIRTTIVRENIQDFEAIDKIAEMFGVKLGIVNYISPRREGDLSSPEGERLSPKELAIFEQKVNQYYMDKQFEINGTLTQENNINQEDAIKQENALKQEMNMTKENLNNPVVTEFMKKINDSFPCTSAKNAFWITWDGRMIPCSLMDKPEAFPFQQGFLSAWEELKTMCSYIPICTDCTACTIEEYCGTCPAKLMNESGSYEQTAPYLCQLAKERKLLDSKSILL